MAIFGSYRFSNPFTGASWSPVQLQAFKDDPRNAYAYVLAANPTSGRNAVSQSFRSFLERWLPEQFQNYSAIGLSGSNLSFADFLAGRDPLEDYLGTFPTMTGQSIYGRPVRMLRR